MKESNYGPCMKLYPYIRNIMTTSCPYLVIQQSSQVLSNNPRHFEKCQICKQQTLSDSQKIIKQHVICRQEEKSEHGIAPDVIFQYQQRQGLISYYVHLFALISTSSTLGSPFSYEFTTCVYTLQNVYASLCALCVPP